MKKLLLIIPFLLLTSNLFGSAIFYLDYENGIDSGGIATNTPLGWWSLAITAGTGGAPVADEACTNGAQHAHLTVYVHISGSWAGNNEAGTLYFYGKTGAFGAGTLSWAAGSGTIAGDANYNPWKTITLGATAARIAPGDIIRIAQSTPPTSLGQTAVWTSTTVTGGGMPATKAISGTTSNGGLIRLTTAVQDWTTNDVIQVLSVGGTVEANGNWLVNVIDTTHVDLQGSSYVSGWTSGGTAQKINSKAVVLTTAVTSAVENCEANWTPGVQTTSSNVDTSIWKEGCSSVKIITAGTCNANQIIAQSATLSTLNLTTKQQISFWIRNETTALAAGDLQVRLYSDATCTVLQETMSLPAIASTTRWVPITINKGSAMYNGIMGIAIYNTVQLNAKTIYIDNFVACGASSADDSLSLQSLISKNTLLQGTTSHTLEGDEAWYGLQSITGQGSTNAGRILLLDNDTNTLSNAGRGYYSGTASPTETITTYKRETIKIATAASLSANTTQTIQDVGSLGNQIQFQGGYSTATNTQIGETFWDGLNGWGVALDGGNREYLTTNYICAHRFNVAFTTFKHGWSAFITNANNNTGNTINIGQTQQTVVIVNANNNTQTGSGVYIPTNAVATTITIYNANNNGAGASGYGVYFESSGRDIANIGNVCNNKTYGLNFSLSAYYVEVTTAIATIASYNGTHGIYIIASTDFRLGTVTTNYNGDCGLYMYRDTARVIINSLTTNNNTNYGIYCWLAGGNLKIFGGGASGNGIAGFYNNYQDSYLRNFTMLGTEFAGTFGNARIYSENHDNTPGYRYIYVWGGNIASDNTTRHTESGISWKFSPTQTQKDSFMPLDLKIARIACVAGKLVTVKAWMKRSSITDIQGTFLIRGAQLTGITTTYANGTTGSATLVGLPFGGADDTNWHEGIITFTPSESGVVEIEAIGYWIASTADESVWIDDMTITVADGDPTLTTMDYSFQGQPHVVNAAGSGGTSNDVFGIIG